MAFPPWTGYNFVSTLHQQVPDNMSPAKQSLPAPFVVCITGASRGIGAETAKTFAAAGATGLILTARTEAALEKTKEACQAIAKSSDLKISTLGADASSPGSAQRLAKLIEQDHARLDLLINNAGLMASDSSAFGRLGDIRDDQFELPMQINTIGRMLTTKYLLPLLLKSENGAKTIINITSLSSHLTFGTPIPFNISELATNRLTEAVAQQYADDGVLAYAVHPGTVRDSDFPAGFPEMFKQGCNDEPDLCGAFCLWLVMDRREWLSGRYLAANWDVKELERRKEEIVEKDLLKMRMSV